MYEQVEKPKDNKSRTVIDSVAHKKSKIDQINTKSVIQCVKIKNDTISAFQASYKFFTKSTKELTDALAHYDNETFNTAEDFINDFVEKYPRFKDDVDKQYVAEKTEEGKTFEIEKKWAKVFKGMDSCDVVKMKGTVDEDAIKHVYERHTVKGIKEVKKILSATEGDIAVFDEAIDIRKIASAIGGERTVDWKHRGGTGYYTDLKLPGVTVRYFGSQVGGVMSVETFFPLDSSMLRADVEELIK